MAELADARDLKSREIFSRTGSTPASGTIISRSGAVWQLVGLITRRSWGSNPISATKEIQLPFWVTEFFLFLLRLWLCAPWPSRLWVRGRSATWGRIICEQVKTIDYRFYAVRHHKARSRQSCSLAKAIGDDYATGAVGHEVSMRFASWRQRRCFIFA